MSDDGETIVTVVTKGLDGSDEIVTGSGQQGLVFSHLLGHGVVLGLHPLALPRRHQIAHQQIAIGLHVDFYPCDTGLHGRFGNCR